MHLGTAMTSTTDNGKRHGFAAYGFLATVQRVCYALFSVSNDGRGFFRIDLGSLELP